MKTGRSSTGFSCRKPFSPLWLLQSALCCSHRQWRWPDPTAGKLSVRQSKPNGFTMTEALLGLLAAGICAALLSSLMESGGRLFRYDPDIQRNLGFLQIRQRAAVSRISSCSETALVMIRNNQEYSLTFSGDRLVQTPGYEILLESLDEGRFACEPDAVWLETEKGRTQIR